MESLTFEALEDILHTTQFLLLKDRTVRVLENRLNKLLLKKRLHYQESLVYNVTVDILHNIQSGHPKGLAFVESLIERTTEVCLSYLTEAIDELSAKEGESDISTKDLAKTLRMFVAYAAVRTQEYAKERSRTLTNLTGKGAIETYVRTLEPAKLSKITHAIAGIDFNNRVGAQGGYDFFVATHLRYAKEIMDAALAYTHQKINSHHLNTTVENLLVCGLSEISGKSVEQLLAGVLPNSHSVSYFAQPVRC